MSIYGTELTLTNEFVEFETLMEGNILAKAWDSIKKIFQMIKQAIVNAWNKLKKMVSEKIYYIKRDPDYLKTIDIKYIDYQELYDKLSNIQGDHFMTFYIHDSGTLNQFVINAEHDQDAGKYIYDFNNLCNKSFDTVSIMPFTEEIIRSEKIPQAEEKTTSYYDITSKLSSGMLIKNNINNAKSKIDSFNERIDKNLRQISEVKDTDWHDGGELFKRYIIREIECLKYQLNILHLEVKIYQAHIEQMKKINNEVKEKLKKFNHDGYVTLDNEIQRSDY